VTAPRTDAWHARVDTAFRAFVADPRFPCLAGKGVMRGDGFRLHVYGALGAARSTTRLARDLAAFVADHPADDPGLQSFVPVFPHAAPRDEASFEARLWEQLRQLDAQDASGAGWDATVSDDPEDPHFSFSFAGRALFVVGLHAASSRLARRFRWPALVFNPHAQFEHLRADGRYARLQAAVREREIALQGSLNPNLADFGDRSEARQYSGRETGPEWRCPFHHDAP
jgi:FPC/CPF motif-containing protein YcgG